MSVVCEMVVKQIIPAVRVRTAKLLYAKGLKQEEIASKLDLTQAAVSKYLSGKYTEKIKKMEKSKVVKKISEEMVEAILNKNFKKSRPEKIICNYCKKGMISWV
ncbi:MAG: helix-turn-helix domain-containing protein, partial [Candidatus Aenigmatarchaeota archaeon]